MKYLEYITGKKTYIIAVATLVFAGLGIVLGYLEPERAVELVIIALTGIGLRHGQTTEIEKAMKVFLKKR